MVDKVQDGITKIYQGKSGAATGLLQGVIEMINDFILDELIDDEDAANDIIAEIEAVILKIDDELL